MFSAILWRPSPHRHSRPVDQVRLAAGEHAAGLADDLEGEAERDFARRIEAGEVPGLTSRADLFGRDGAGPDMIHLSDLGHYVVALTHYAVLTGESPLGLPDALVRADGEPAQAPGPEAARIMQEVVWQVVSRYAPTGVSG